MTTDWQTPAALPDLRRVGIIALDIETKDEGLIAGTGSAWPWHGGYICGISVAYREEGAVRALYFPLRHPDSHNFDREQLFQWLKDLVASDVRIVTQNGLYDFGWLRAEDGILMPLSDRLEEIGALATMVDENRHTYGLDALCAWRGLPGKDESLLREAAKAAGFKISTRNKLQSYIWQLPARYVGPYAAADAANTLALRESLDPILDREGTRAAYRLEVDLLPMVHEMRRRGVRTDTVAAESARDQLLKKRDATFAELSEKLGANVGMEEIGRNKWLVKIFDQQGIAYPRTAKGSASFTAGSTGWMHKHAHWLPQLIVKADKYNNAAVNFLENHILGHTVNGRIHAEIHPHRSDEGGARSLRFSYSNPPLQQMVSRDEELAPLIRGVFLPEEGEMWAKPDVSQQEFRFIVHYAAQHDLPRAKDAVARYCTDPNTDFHNMVVEMTGLDRTSAKNANFAKAFGAGVRKFAAMIGRPEAEARAIYNRYDRELPFVSRLAAICQNDAAKRGFLVLYDEARRHWDSWEVGIAWEKGTGPCSREEAERRCSDPTHRWHGMQYRLRRADTHKAMNALIQGSAARHTKLWMRACWREGIVPLLQLHDSLDCSVSSPELAERVSQLGRDAVTLAVPMQVDLRFGRNWGDAKHTWEAARFCKPLPAPVTVAVGDEVVPKRRASQEAAGEICEVPPCPSTPENSHQELNLEGSGCARVEETKIPRLADLIGAPLVNGKTRCPFHDDNTPSCHIYDDHWYCYGCGAHGDHIDWLMMVDGLDRAEAIRRIKTWDGPIARPRAPSTAKFRTNALRLWEQSRPIAGTLAATYLANTRHVELDALPANVDEVLRFHPRCPFGPGTQHPCLVALLRSVETDQPVGIHRIALTSDGNKIGRMQLGDWGPVKLWPAGTELVIAEGIETTLAAATRFSYRDTPLQPAWSAISSGKLGTFPVLPGVKQLIVLVDHDANGVGQAAAERCRERWRRAGRDVIRLMSGQPGADFNDIVIPEGTLL